MNKLSTVVTIALTALTLLLVTRRFGAGDHGPRYVPSVVRIGVAQAGTGSPPVFGYASAGTLHSQKRLERALAPDSRVEWTFYKGAGPAVNEALATGQLDFAYQGDLPSLLGRANGVETRLLAATSARQDLLIATPAASRIRSIAELRGKRVAMAKGTNAELPFIRLLDAYGLSERDLKLVNLDSVAAQSALAASDVDAAVGGFELLVLRNQGIARVLYTSKGDDAIYTKQAHFLVTAQFEARYPALVQRVVNELVQAALYSSDEHNREALFAHWAKTGIPAEVWREAHEGLPMNARYSPKFDPFLTERYRQAAQDALRLKLIRTEVDVERWIERGYLERALASAKLTGAWPDHDALGVPTATARR